MVKNKDLIEFEKKTGIKVLELISNPEKLNELPIEPVLNLAEKIDPDADPADAIGLVYAYFTKLSIKALQKVNEQLEQEGMGQVLELIKKIGE